MRTVGTGLTVRGLNGLFYPAYDDAMMLHRILCTPITSDGDKEDYKFLGTNPMPNEWLGERKTTPHESYGFTVFNKHYESTLDIDRDEADDDQTGQIARRTSEFGQRFALHGDVLLVALIEAGFGSTLGLAYDGQNFFDTDHAEGESGTMNNDLTSNITTPANPTQAEFKAALWGALEALMDFKDDRGQPVNFFTKFEDFSNIAVLAPTNMMEVANEVLGPNGVDTIVTTSGNAAQSNNLKGRGTVWPSPLLTNNDRFYVFYVGDQQKPFIFQSRQKVITKLKDDRDHKNVRYMADARYAVAFADFKRAVGHVFT